MSEVTLVEFLLELAKRLREGDWNLRVPQEMADMLADMLEAAAERHATPAPMAAPLTQREAIEAAGEALRARFKKPRFVDEPAGAPMAASAAPVSMLDSPQTTESWQSFVRTADYRRALQWIEQKEGPGALFVAFRSGLATRPTSPQAAPESIDFETIRDLVINGGTEAMMRDAELAQARTLLKRADSLIHNATWAAGKLNVEMVHRRTIARRAELEALVEQRDAMFDWIKDARAFDDALAPRPVSMQAATPQQALAIDHLRWLLPMAKAYAREHPVGRNQALIDEVVTLFDEPWDPSPQAASAALPEIWTTTDSQEVLSAAADGIWRDMQTWGDPDDVGIRRFCYRRNRWVNSGFTDIQNRPARASGQSEKNSTEKKS